MATITPPKLLEAMQRIDSRGAIETARRALQACGQVFGYAIAIGRAERNPAADSLRTGERLMSDIHGTWRDSKGKARRSGPR